MYHTSSNSARVINPDGSTNVYCYQCFRFIATTFLRVNRALCEMCRRVEAGEPVSLEAMKEYEASKLGRADVSLLRLDEPKTGAKFTLRSMGGEILQALKQALPQKPKPKSKEISDEKRRGRLFEQVDLGAMEKVDKQLKEAK